MESFYSFLLFHRNDRRFTLTIWILNLIKVYFSFKVDFLCWLYFYSKKRSQVYFTVWLTVQRGILVHNASNKHIGVVQNAQTICLNVNKNIFRNIVGYVCVGGDIYLYLLFNLGKWCVKRSSLAMTVINRLQTVWTKP